METSKLTKLALEELDRRNIEAWRQNNLRVPGRTFYGRRGVSDLLGFNRSTGIMVLCEVKNEGDKLSQDQVDLLNIAFKAGAITLIATVDKKGDFLLVHYKPD
jgi:hypothetical protein